MIKLFFIFNFKAHYISQTNVVRQCKKALENSYGLSSKVSDITRVICPQFHASLRVNHRLARITLSAMLITLTRCTGSLNAFSRSIKSGEHLISAKPVPFVGLINTALLQLYRNAHRRHESPFDRIIRAVIPTPQYLSKCLNRLSSP